MNRSANVAKAEYVLKKMLLDPSNTAYLGGYAWPSESDRLSELVASIMSAVCDRPRTELREIACYLDDLGHLDVGELARVPIHGDQVDVRDECAEHILHVLKDRDIPDDQASAALRLVCQLARGLDAHFAGKLQRYLRKYAEIMLDDLPSCFAFTGVAGEDVRKAFTYWLQVALSMPVSLQDAGVQKLCSDHGIEAADLWEAADNLGVNVAVVDDLAGLCIARSSAPDSERTG